MAVNFDSVIRAWLRADPADRDPAKGALLLLRIDRNQVFYRAALAAPKRYLPQIEERLRAHLARRSAIPSKEMAQALADEADRIVAPGKSVAALFRAGRRADHDSLPEEIRRLYADNLDIRRRMQQIHLQIRTLRASDAECSREDIRDLVALLRASDVKYHENWRLYDKHGKENT